MRSELGHAGLDFERIPAVDGSLLSEEDLEAFCRERMRGDHEEWLPGEVGCFLSHFEAWRRVAASQDEWQIVFEDDLRVSPDIARLVQSAGWIPADADVVRLEANRSMRLSRPRQIAAAPGRRLYRAVSGTTGAGAYILSRKTAQQLIAAPASEHTKVDTFLFKPKVSSVARGLKRYQLVPAVCVQVGLAEGREGHLKSTIRTRATFGRGYRERSHPLLRLWPIRRIAVPFRA